MDRKTSLPLSAGEQQNELESLIELHRQEPENSVVLNNLGILSFKAGLYAEATTWFARLAELITRLGVPAVGNETAATVYQNLAQSAMQSGNLDVARTALLQLRAITVAENSFVNTNLERLALTRLQSSLLEAEADTESFITYHVRPSRCSSYGLTADHFPEEKVAVVIQGPLLTFQDFTLETVKLYRQIFPYCQLIISTWADEDGILLKKLSDAGAHVVLNEKPARPGSMNINMQLRSARNGIVHAEQSGATYVLKTRSDYRIYNPYFFIDALNLLNAFPLSPATQSMQKMRLIALSDLNRYVIYSVQDRNMFGHMTDMIKYWSPPEDDRDKPGDDLQNPLQLARFGYAESYLFTRYMSGIGRELKWSLTDFWDILKEHFVIMDEAAADAYWCKHVRNLEYRYKQYTFNSNFERFGFLDWLRLYQGNYPMLDDPRIIERKHGSYLSDILKEHLQKTAERISEVGIPATNNA